MHEYGLVEGILSRVEHEARTRGASRVHSVKVSVGELSGVDATLLVRCWDTFREPTVCAGAPLEVRHVPARWACSSCAAPLLRGERLRCKRCGAPAKLVEGEDLMLERIEMELAPH